MQEDSQLKFFPKNVPSIIKERLSEGEEVIALAELGKSPCEIPGSLILTNKRIMVYVGGEVEELPLSDVKEAYIKTYLNVCVLAVKLDGSAKSLAVFSKSRFKVSEKLATLINNIVIGKIPYSILKKSIMAKRKAERRKLFRELFARLKPAWPLIAASMVLAVLLRILDLAPPYLMKILVDEVLVPKKHLEKLYSLLGMLLAIFSCQIMLNVVKGYTSTKLNLKISRTIRYQLFHKLQRASIIYHERFTSGGLYARIFDDVGRLQNLVSNTLERVVINVSAIAFIGALLITLSVKLTMIVLLPIPVTFLAAFIFSRFAPIYYYRVWRKWSNVVSTVSDSLSAILPLKIYRREAEYEEQFLKSHGEYEVSQVSTFKLEQAFWPPVWLVFIVCSLLVWLIGGLDVMNNALSLGSLIAFATYMWEFYNPIFGLIESFSELQKVKVSLERVFELLELEEEEEGSYSRKIEGDIEYENVWFTYDGIHYALKGVSFHIKAGQCVGVVGPSGAGKTTMVKLLLGLYKPQFGSVKVDEVKLENYDLEALRKQVAIVLQDTPLFNATVAENLLVGKPIALPLDIMQAAKLAAAHEFVMKLPEAYDTEVGEKGARLSGGEKARIALAAALIRNPKILVLDEPTAMLDSLTEDKVMEALERAAKGRTTIIIAHRLSTLKFADNILVMDNGRIVEQGSHEQLLERGGLYARLWSSQLKALTRREVVALDRKH